MSGCFLSIDWDYFIESYTGKSSSYRETQRDILVKWYNEFFMDFENGKSIEDDYTLGEAYELFIEQIVPKLNMNKKCPLYLSESHGAAYEKVKQSGCNQVYLLDAHSDLGYGGLEALNYEVNCANWLGKLLKEGQIKEAFIIYSPYTREYAEEFEEISKAYRVQFVTLEAFLKMKVTFKAVHICRSGPWTPPWYDMCFYHLADALQKSHHLEIEDQVGGLRKWEPMKLSLAERINYKLGIV